MWKRGKRQTGGSLYMLLSTSVSFFPWKMLGFKVLRGNLVKAWEFLIKPVLRVPPPKKQIHTLFNSNWCFWRKETVPFLPPISSRTMRNPSDSDYSLVVSPIIIFKQSPSRYEPCKQQHLHRRVALKDPLGHHQRQVSVWLRVLIQLSCLLLLCRLCCWPVWIHVFWWGQCSESRMLVRLLRWPIWGDKNKGSLPHRPCNCFQWPGFGICEWDAQTVRI